MISKIEIYMNEQQRLQLTICVLWKNKQVNENNLLWLFNKVNSTEMLLDDN